MKFPILLLALTFFAVGCSSSSDDDVVLNDTVADEVVQEEDAIVEGDEVVQEDEVLASLPSQPIDISHSYVQPTFFVAWNAPIDGPEVSTYEIRINGQFIQNPEIIDSISVENRFIYQIEETLFGINIVEIFSTNEAGMSEPAVQWIFDDPARVFRLTNIGIIGEPIDRQFFEFPLRNISTIDNRNYVSIAQLMLNALQIEPELNGNVLRGGESVPISDLSEDQTTTEVFLCENNGRRGFFKFRAGGLRTDFDNDAYGDCLLDGNVVDGWLNQRISQTSDPDVIFDERFTLNLSGLSSASDITSGQFVISALTDETISISVTIEDGFMSEDGAFWSSGVMTAVAGDASTLTIDATTNDSRTVSYTLSNDGESTSGILPWPKSNLPSPPANITRNNLFSFDDVLLWPGATDDTVNQLAFEITLNGNLIETVTQDFRDYTNRRTNFESGYFRFPSSDNAVDELRIGLYSIVTIDPEGNRSEPTTFLVE